MPNHARAVDDSRPGLADNRRLKLLGGPQSGVDADLRIVVDQAAERLEHHDFEEGQGCERGGYRLNEVDPLLFSARLKDLPAGGVRDALHRKVPRGVVADRIDGDAVMWVEFGVIVNEDAQYARVRGSHGQHLVDLLSNLIAAAYSASRLNMKNGRRSTAITDHFVGLDGQIMLSVSRWTWVDAKPSIGVVRWYHLPSRRFSEWITRPSGLNVTSSSSSCPAGSGHRCSHTIVRRSPFGPLSKIISQFCSSARSRTRSMTW
jgi:hypothetical protein